MDNVQKLKQPKSFYMIFILEFWERFGYYGMQGIITIYFVRALGLTEAKAYSTFGALIALVYGMVAAGGYIGDKVLGTKRTIILGTIVLFLGYLFLGFSNNHTVFIALGIITVGNGLFKANPSSLLSKCYKENDPRLHGGFTLFYMAVNLGSFVSMLLTPVISEKLGWNAAFLVCAIGLFLALANFIFFYKSIAHINSEACRKKVSITKWVTVIALTAIASYASGYLLQHLTIAHIMLWTIATTVILIYFKFLFREHGITRKKMLVAFILMLQAIVFFTLYQQMPTSLTFFAIHNVNTSLLGFNIHPAQFQTLNPFWIMALSPILAIIYNKLGSKGKDIPMARKFAVGMTLCAMAFLLLYVCKYFADDHSKVSAWWLVGGYFFQSTGELMIGALGMAMIAELVPQKIVGFAMGMWFLKSAISGVTGSMLAKYTAVPKTITDPAITLHNYTHVFLLIGIIVGVVAIIMWLTSGMLVKYIQPDQDVDVRETTMEPEGDIHHKAEEFEKKIESF